MNKYLAFDLEIALPFPESDNVDHSKLGISCAATLPSTGESKVFHSAYMLVGHLSDPRSGMWHERMARHECQNLVDYLSAAEFNDYTIVCWNGNFDFRVLAYECGDKSYYAQCQELARRMIDPMVQFTWLRRHYIGLEKVAQTMVGKSKEGMHGQDAPIIWNQSAEGQAKVLEYVLGDVELTLAVVKAIERTQMISWISGSGRPWDVYVGELMTVKEVMETKPGNVPHWMTEPPSLGNMVGWLE